MELSRWTALVLASTSMAPARAQTTTVASITEWAPIATPAEIGVSSISADGRFVVFANPQALVVGDTNGQEDVYVRDRWLGRTDLVSVTTGGGLGNGQCRLPTISGDGSCVGFHSLVSNLVPGDTNGARDVFLRDRATQATTRVSVGTSGQQGDGASFTPRISSDARYLVFGSIATNLVAGDVNERIDIFLRDLTTGTTELVSVATGGAQGDGDSDQACVSDDGRFVAFDSIATNFAAADTNGAWDIFVRDRVLGVTQRVSVSTAGAQANSASWFPKISRDGAWVSFHSSASNLVFGDTTAKSDMFARDLAAGVTVRTSLNWNGAQLNAHVNLGSFSADGRFVVFSTNATNAAPGVWSNLQRVYVRDREGLTPETYCAANPNSAGCVPQIDWRGIPSLSHGAGFLIGATQVLDQRVGSLFYGVSGPQATPLAGGVLCVRPRVRRTRPQTADTLGAPPCGGVFAFDFNRLLASGVDPELRYGDLVWAQYWSRDPASPSGANLTDALTFAIGP